MQWLNLFGEYLLFNDSGNQMKYFTTPFSFLFYSFWLAIRPECMKALLSIEGSGKNTDFLE